MIIIMFLIGTHRLEYVHSIGPQIIYVTQTRCHAAATSQKETKHEQNISVVS